jgi:hypothetical protein
MESSEIFMGKPFIAKDKEKDYPFDTDNGGLTSDGHR